MTSTFFARRALSRWSLASIAVVLVLDALVAGWLGFLFLSAFRVIP